MTAHRQPLAPGAGQPPVTRRGFLAGAAALGVGAATAG